MKTWRQLFLAGSLAALGSGCTSTPANPWSDLEVPADSAVLPLVLPAWPTPVSYDAESVTFDLAGAQELDAFKTAAEANTEIATENAKTVDSQNRAIADLVRAGQGQRVIADMRAEMLEDERRHNFFEKIGLWVVVVALGASSL